MRILLLSDISWRRTGLGSLKRGILSLDPSLVLLAGDLVDNDHSDVGGAEKWSGLYEFVDFLNENKTQTFFIRGNWDRAPYDCLIGKAYRLPYVEEISGRIVEFDRVRILGVPFSLTNHLPTAKRLRELFPDPVDIVLAHAEILRRIWLFELNTRFVVTGHFDSQLCQVRDKTFVSLSGFPSNYAIVDYGRDVQRVTCFERCSPKRRGASGRTGSVQQDETRISSAQLVDGQLAWNTEPLRSSTANGKYRHYCTWVESLFLAKEQIDARARGREEAATELRSSCIPKKHIWEYIGGKV